MLVRVFQRSFVLESVNLLQPQILSVGGRELFPVPHFMFFLSFVITEQIMRYVMITDVA